LPTYLSGIQPTGLPHLGNYFGAIQQHVALQEQGGEHFYFIADYHALTTSREAAGLRERVHEIAVTYLAFGLDPERAIFFRQSDVPEVCELTWLLACVTGMGLLERAHSYKDKTAKGIAASAGLFLYPVLMAADILAYDSDRVPVGQDQVQHIEMAQDMAQAFNARYGEVFRRPEPLLSKHTKVPGLDGQKMSKSYQNDVWVFETGKPLKKAVGSITTDSRPPSEPKDPDSILLFEFLRLFLPPQELEQWRERVRAGGPEAPGYGHMKQRLCEAIEAAFAPARARRERLLADPGAVERALQHGAARARERARATRDRALSACGLRA
jgi:tryptophanyl-tRNA synthetase